MNCPGTNTIVALLEGHLPASQRTAVLGHLDGCDECLALVAEAGKQTASGEHPRPGEAKALAAGTAIGRYLVVKLVGSGGMGDVYLAYDPKLNRRVALKLMNDRVASPMLAARFAREAQAVARLSHPNVVAIHDAGEFDGRVYLAMEFVEGQTLAEWLRAAPRTWREIRDVFLAAGTGLTAAHEAGLVHRDFKPQNVMVGRDGSVRVMDFGLAEETQGHEDVRDIAATTLTGEATPGLTAQTLALTRSGVLLGTPLYMAPEQLLGRKTDARSDQFSFCVSLFEAIHGERPFPSSTLSELTEAVVAGRVREPNAKTRAPSFLRRLLLRGLAVDPAARFASMRDLLQDLAYDPVRRRRAVALGLVGAAVAVAALAGGQRFATRGQRMCRSGADRLGGIWDLDAGGERRGAIHQAFVATGRPSAGETWTRVSALLDDYARRWTATYADSCEATHVRGDQSPAVLDLRMDCLEQARHSFRALTDILSRVDGKILLESVNAARALPDIDRCSDVSALRAVVPPPTDAGARTRVLALQARLAEVKALRDTGQWKNALGLAQSLAADARAVDYEPLLAEVLSTRSWLEQESGDPAKAVMTLEEAVWMALGSHRDDIAAEAAAQLVGINGYHLSRFADAERWQRAADELVTRLGPGHERISSWLHQDRADAAQRRGDLKTALAEMETALALKRKALPPDHPDIGITEYTISLVDVSLGNTRAGLAAADRALAIYRIAYGDQSPQLWVVLDARAEALESLGRYQEAEKDLRVSIARAEELFGVGHVWTAVALVDLGKVLLDEGEPGLAVPVLESAVRIRDQSDPNPENVAEAHFALARALWTTPAGQDRPRALALAKAARDSYRSLPLHEKELAAVDAWLAAK